MLTFGVIVLASLFASFTDWLFMDVIVHRFYASNPQTWRPNQGSVRIVSSQIIGTAASAAVIVLCLFVPGRPLLVAGAAWCAGTLSGHGAKSAMDQDASGRCGQPRSRVARAAADRDRVGSLAAGRLINVSETRDFTRNNKNLLFLKKKKQKDS